MAAPLPALVEMTVPVGVELRLVVPSQSVELGEAYWSSYDGEWTAQEGIDDVLGSFAGHSRRLVPNASLAAVSGDRILGAIFTVTGAPWPDTPQGAFIIDVFVIPDARRRGIGRALVEHAMPASPGSTIALRVEDDNEPARRLYAALGFVDAANTSWV